MDLMTIRRKLLIGIKKNYLQNVEWIINNFIDTTGNIKGGSSSKYTKNVIVLDSGQYVLYGINRGTSTRFRIHEYNSNDVWQRMIYEETINYNKNVNIHFSVPNGTQMRIRLSINKFFVGVLTKV